MGKKGSVLNRFYRTFVSFAVCLMLVLIPAYWFTHSLFANNCIQSSEEMLESGMRRVETHIANLTNSVVELLSDESFQSMMGLNKPKTSQYYQVYQSMLQFQRTMRYRNVGPDCGMILPNGIVFDYRRVHMDAQSMYDIFFSVEGFDTYSAWYEAMLPTHGLYRFLPERTIRSDTQYQGVLVGFRPMSDEKSLSSRVKHLLFYFTITPDFLEENLILTDVMESGALRIYDADGMLLYENTNSTTEPFASITCESSVLGLQAEIGINRETIAKKLSGFRMTILTALGLFAAASLVLSLGYARRVSRPIRALSAQVTSLGTGKALSQPMAQRVQEYTHISEKISQADRLIGQQNEMLRSVALKQVFSAEAGSEAQIRLAEYFPDFPQRYVLLLVRPRPGRPADLQATSADQMVTICALEKALPPHTIFQPMSYSGTLLAIIPMPKGHEPQELNAALQQAYAELEDEVPASFVLSPALEGMQRAADMYSQLHTMARIFQGEGFSVLHCPAEVTADATESVLHQDPAMFFSKIKQGDSQGALALMDQTLESLRMGAGISEQTIVVAFYNFACQLLRARSMLSDDMARHISVPVYDAHVPIETLWQSLADCTVQMCALINDHQQRLRSTKKQAILDYISENIGDSELCAQSIMDRFGVTEYGLQSIVRQESGRSFFDHLQSMRMTMARRLILESPAPLAEIITQCGYSSRNTFYKAFKRTFGQAPSEMRRLSGLEEDESEEDE